jgi:hypothetical protein
VFRGQHAFHDWQYATAFCPAPKCDKPIILVFNNSTGFQLQVFPRDADRARCLQRCRQRLPPATSRPATSCRSAPRPQPHSPVAACRTCCTRPVTKTKTWLRRLSAIERNRLKALPLKTHQTIDGIRNFGNFSAHPINDKTTLQVIDVKPHEAEWCLEPIEEVFDHFYVGPALAKAKKDALDAKVAAAGKPPSKS